MPSANDLIKEKTSRLTKIPDEFLDAVSKSQKELFPEVVDLLSKLKVDSQGNIILDNANLELSAELKEQLKQILLDSDYISAVKEFAKQFDTQATITNQLVRKAFDFSDFDKSKKLIQLSKRNASDILINSIGDDAFANAITEQVNIALSNNASFKETIKSIQDIVIGNDKVDGKLQQYAKQVAHDQFAIADRSYTSAVAEEVGAEWFKYSGDTIESTREFCEVRHNKFYYYKEIEEWADLKWDGKIPGTTEKTIFSTAGGYNCRHSIIPVSIFAVPKKDIERNINNGNFKPSDKLKKQLGLD